MWHHKFDPHTHVPELPLAPIIPMPEPSSMARPLGGPFSQARPTQFKGNETVREFLDRSNINITTTGALDQSEIKAQDANDEVKY